MKHTASVSLPAETETPFIPFTSDYGFKATFGNEADTRFLRKALQALVGTPTAIAHIEFVKTDFLAFTLDGRSGVYDLACTDEQGSHFIVEMQVSEYPQFMQRMKFYALHKFNTMVKKGKYFFTELTPIYCVGILSQNIFPDNRDYYHRGVLTSQTGCIMDPLLSYITVELDKFSLAINEVSTDLEKLIFTMKNLPVYAEAPPTQYPAFWTEEWLDIAIRELDTRRFTPEQMEQYVITLAKNAAVIEDERKKIEAARTETTVFAIRNALRRGKLTHGEIAEDHNVSEAFVREIAQQMADEKP